jgi:hypothetical protein
MLWVAREGPKDKCEVSACASSLRASACMVVFRCLGRHADTFR